MLATAVLIFATSSQHPPLPSLSLQKSKNQIMLHDNTSAPAKTRKNADGTPRVKDVSNCTDGVTSNKNGKSVEEQQKIERKPASNISSQKSVIFKETSSIHDDPIQESKHNQDEAGNDYDMAEGVATPDVEIAAWKRWSTAHEDEDSSEFDLDELLETDTLWEEWDARWEEKHEEDQKREEARMGGRMKK